MRSSAPVWAKIGPITAGSVANLWNELHKKGNKSK